MSTNMDGPDALIEEVMELPVEDIYTLLSTVIDRLRPLAQLVNAGIGAPVLARYNLDLIAADAGKKSQTIKEIRGITKLGLKEAKDIVDHVIATGTPSRILNAVPEDEVERARKALIGVNASPSVSTY